MFQKSMKWYESKNEYENKNGIGGMTTNKNQT